LAVYVNSEFAEMALYSKPSQFGQLCHRQMHTEFYSGLVECRSGIGAEALYTQNWIWALLIFVTYLAPKFVNFCAFWAS